MTGVAHQDVAQVVAQAWCTALGFEALPPDANLFSLGGDSLIAVMVAAEVSQRLGIEVGLADLVEAPTFDEFVARVGRLAADG